jgi:hypothetical protein
MNRSIYLLWPLGAWPAGFSFEVSRPPPPPGTSCPLPGALCTSVIVPPKTWSNSELVSSLRPCNFRGMTNSLLQVLSNGSTVPPSGAQTQAATALGAGAMSALDHKQTFCDVRTMSALSLETDTVVTRLAPNGLSLYNQRLTAPSGCRWRMGIDYVNWSAAKATIWSKTSLNCVSYSS